MVKKGRQAERTVLRGLLLTSHKDEDTQPQGRRTLYDKELDWPMSPSVCQVASKPWDFFQLIEISAVMIISDSLHPQRDFQWALHSQTPGDNTGSEVAIARRPIMELGGWDFNHVISAKSAQKTETRK